MSPPLISKRVRGWKLILCLLPLLFIQHTVLAQPQPEDTLLFREGEVLLSKGETEKALWRFKSLVTDYPKSPLVHEAKFRMGICYTQLKRPKDAIRILNELFSTFLSPSRMVQVFSLLGDNHLELRDRVAALHWYGKALLVSGQPKEELRKKVRSIIDTFDGEDDLKQIESLYRGAYGGGYAKWKLAQMAKRRGNDLLAKKMLTELETEYSGADYVSPTKVIPEPIPLPSKTKYTVGVILPLSGPYQRFGERALQGIQLAIKEMDAQGKTPLVSLVTRDSKENPVEAEKAVEELVTKEKAIAIIGPLLSTDVEMAAKKAQQLKVPIITLSQKEFSLGKGEFVFQNSLTPSDQIQTLVAFALKTLTLKSFGVFYPNSPYGLHFKNLFMQEVSRKGGKVLGVVAYQEEQTDFSSEIKRFFKIEAIRNQESPRKTSGDEFKSDLSVDGLFIPDTYDRVGLIISQIAYYDVKGLTFLGTNVWNGPDLIPIAGKSTEGAVFTDAFSKNNPFPPSAHFVEEFRKAYQRDPETLEALCYDGAKLLGEILRSKSISSPLQLNEEISRFQNFEGVSGLKGFGEGGKPVRNLSILRVNKGQIELVSQ
jgi:branched-chain amino acid transport system substrate-binding protein